VEFWNHGWDHKQWDDAGKKTSEFGGSGYEHQKEAIAKSQAAALRVLGQPIVAFGSGFNAMDMDTARALNETSELQLIFLYAGTAPSRALKGKVLLPMALAGENDGTGKPNFAKFKEIYARKSGASLTFTALQFHPLGFSEQGFTDFAAIVDFMKAEGWTFLLPSEYARRLPPTPCPALPGSRSLRVVHPGTVAPASRPCSGKTRPAQSVSSQVRRETMSVRHSRGCPRGAGALFLSFPSWGPVGFGSLCAAGERRPWARVGSEDLAAVSHRCVPEGNFTCQDMIQSLAITVTGSLCPRSPSLRPSACFAPLR